MENKEYLNSIGKVIKLGKDFYEDYYKSDREEREIFEYHIEDIEDVQNILKEVVGFFDTLESKNVNTIDKLLSINKNKDSDDIIEILTDILFTYYGVEDKFECIKDPILRLKYNEYLDLDLDLPSNYNKRIELFKESIELKYIDKRNSNVEIFLSVHELSCSKSKKYLKEIFKAEEDIVNVSLIKNNLYERNCVIIKSKEELLKNEELINLLKSIKKSSTFKVINS